MIETVWEKVPDWRLGQLLLNATGKYDIFYVKDDIIEAALVHLLREVGRMETVKNEETLETKGVAYFFDDGIIFFDRKGNPVVNNDCTTYSIIKRNAKMLSESIKSLPDDRIRLLLEWTIHIDWGEGNIILQREIAKRGLHSESSGDRFEL